MPRLHLKQFLIVSIVLLLFCIVVLLSLHKSDSNSRKPHKDFDSKVWEQLSMRTTQKPSNAAPAGPRIHVKKMTSVFDNGPNMKMSMKQVENMFFSYLENKDIRCDKDERLGSMHDGGWNVCMSRPFDLQDPCIVFSFGIGSDWQFDDAISQIYKCKVLAFDPSIPEPTDRRSPLIQFQAIGIDAENMASNKYGWEVKTLGQHLTDAGYDKVPVDYVKIDVEYMEWEVLRSAFREGSLKNVKQLGFEIHTARFKNSTWRGESSEKLDFIHMYETLRRVEIVGFRKFNYRKNPFGNYHSLVTGKEQSCCYELHYINMEFVSDNDTVLHTHDDRKTFH